MSRCALSVSTAGVYGAWEAGAIEALLREAPAVQNEPRRRWDALYGASAGAINVAVLSAYEDQMEGARALTDFWIRGASVWREPTVGACVACARQCLGKVSMLDDTALRSVLSFVDWQQVGRHAETWVAVTNAETQHSELLPLRNPDEGLTSAARAKIARDNMDVVVASSSVPALWPAVRVGSGGPYVDSLLTLPVPYPGGAGPGSGGPPVDRLEIVVAPSSPLARTATLDLVGAISNSAQIAANVITNYNLDLIRVAYGSRARLWAQVYRETRTGGVLRLDPSIARSLVEEGRRFVTAHRAGTSVDEIQYRPTGGSMWSRPPGVVAIPKSSRRPLHLRD